ncbi:division/outer membrane stress-associated lipid-binding lipoprotein [Psychrobium sp. 1_MG-2023]|uniref:division/outer membrane stress-associated lipid-binding lipoprotein n=1 Tax=Psychrobium sp. 1_MG-2023 TaxID=3062624 RepID=UPI000C3343B6|nr:division/outer membrane stress-associated lipid-binding lipoprotein [Psychrobium sp. 1_MG-2023]MDP2559621.1 division/outer membrane stress-associated lipid-binding lipoprotein [Psychrobium sp. 1_MG-2023]PKF59454.1 osmotically-inducible protein OsmY [Alteromonadales bacterium alter-6D02]
MMLFNAKPIKLAALLAVFLSLQGCVTGVVLGAVGIATVANDRRTAASQLEDESIELKASSLLSDDKGISEHSHINVISYNRMMLVVGQAPNEMLRNRVITLLRTVPNVTKIHNQIRIGNPIQLKTRTKDSWLTSKIKVAMTADTELASSQVKVITEYGEVFLLGLVSQAEGNKAAEIARNVSGVKKVIKVFEYQKI